MLRLALGLLVPLLLALASRATAAAATDPAGYRAGLGEALATLERGDLGPEERARLAAERLRALGPVVLADGAEVEPDVGTVLGPLEARPPELDAARGRLRTLVEALDATEPGTAAPDAEARLRHVLDRSEFGQAQPNRVAEWLDGAWARLREWVRSWLPRVDDAPAGPEIGDLRTPLALAGLLILLGVLALVATGLGRNLGRTVIASPLGRPATQTWEEVMAEASRLAQAGRYREAVRALYVATLLRGEALDLIRFDRALTNRELLERARARGGPDLAARLAGLVERFDDFWYGGAPGSGAEYDEIGRLAAGLWTPA
ncbi:MAG TPA: DUF4129 domain-containing protein [Chloroflexota bacterium]